MSREKILIIDDDRDFLNIISIILTEEGYDVDAATTAEEALNKSFEELYSVILIDIRLPDLDGLQLLQRILDTDPNIVKIIVTGHPSLENAQEAVNKGANGYLIKPIKAEELLEMIDGKLREREGELTRRYPSLKY